MKSITENQKKLTAFGALGGMLLGIGTKKNTAITIVYTLTFGAIGYFIGEKI
jgi:hypothetical protein